MTRCVDVTPPVLVCPESITVPAEEGLHYATLNMTVPVSQDNSGSVPTIVSIPALTEKMKLKIGTTQIRIASTDLTGNTKKCSFSITVIGRYNTFQSIFKALLYIQRLNSSIGYVFIDLEMNLSDTLNYA